MWGETFSEKSVSPHAPLPKALGRVGRGEKLLKKSSLFFYIDDWLYFLIVIFASFHVYADECILQ